MFPPMQFSLRRILAYVHADGGILSPTNANIDKPLE